MAKRFIDTSIFKKDFVRGLEAPYKLLWIYLLAECDHAGLWDVELEIAEIRLKTKFKTDPLSVFKGKIFSVNDGKKWFIPSFIEFQYGSLKENNNTHNSVIQHLKKQNLLNDDLSLNLPNEELGSPSGGVIDIDKDKVSNKDKSDQPLNLIIPPTWDHVEFDRLLSIWIGGRKKQKKSCSNELIQIRVSELVAAFPLWTDAKKKLTEAAHEGWLKLVYDNQINQTKKNGIFEPSQIRDRA